MSTTSRVKFPQFRVNSGSRDLLKFGKINANISETTKIEI